jgi:hypothetical protein
MMPVITQIDRMRNDEGSSRAIEPGTIKMPTPIVVPMTMQVESKRLSRRGNSDGFETEGAEVKLSYRSRKPLLSTVE